jgi:hypothetical protein
VRRPHSQAAVTGSLDGDLTYTVRTMMTRRRDARDALADQISQLIDAATNHPGNPAKIDNLLNPSLGVPPLHGWPEPTPEARVLANVRISRAVEAVCERARARRYRLTLISRVVPNPAIRLDAGIVPNLLVAPLVGACLQPEAIRELTHLAAYLYSPRTVQVDHEVDEILASKFGDDEVRHQLQRRLNRYANAESELWRLAAEAGYTHRPPYAARYFTNCWLSSPEITGIAFCTRCGDHLSYERRPRGGTPRSFRCDHCARGREHAWPPHAICPGDTGRWWLWCSEPGCRQHFIGRAQARYCERHRSAAMTPSRRRR